MHDPCTVAFTIPYGWKTLRFGNGRKWRYWKPLFTIWHVDPETDGSDDSCGWHTPPLQDKHRKVIEELVREDLSMPYFSSPSIPQSAVVVDPEYQYLQQSAGDCVAHVFAAWQLIAWRLDQRHVSHKELLAIVRLGSCAHDNLRSVLANSELRPEDRVRRFFLCVMRAYLRERRWWFQYPKWHVWHWRVQCHPLQTFKRWAFSKCCRCGKGFRWGYSPVSESWSGDGPQWFRSEKHVYHADCRNPNDDMSKCFAAE